MDNELLHQLKITLRAACDGAAEILMGHFGNLKEISHKGEIDLVTIADREAERVAIETIRADFAEHSILAEETGVDAGMEEGFRWIIDPLDGTTNFAHSLPVFSVSIGLEHHGRMLLGMVKAPALGETFFAERGQGATLNGKAIHVSKVADLRQALTATGFAYDRHERAHYYLKYVAEMMQRAQGIRRAGSASLDLCSVACGRIDVYWEENIQPWDIAAGMLIAEEAGARVTNYRGGMMRLSERQIVASNGLVHDAAVAVLGPIWNETHPAQ